MARPRSTYLAEFKLAAVRMITEQNLSVAEAARRLDVGENPLREWRTPGDEQLRRLRAERDLVDSRRVLRQPATYQFIADHAAEQPVRWMCDALDVSASGYYARAARADSPTQRWRDELVGVIDDVHAGVRQRSGSPRIRGALNAGARRVRRIRPSS